MKGHAGDSRLEFDVDELERRLEMVAATGDPGDGTDSSHWVVIIFNQ
jgi:hypothetical protein